MNNYYEDEEDEIIEIDANDLSLPAEEEEQQEYQQEQVSHSNEVALQGVQHQAGEETFEEEEEVEKEASEFDIVQVQTEAKEKVVLNLDFKAALVNDEEPVNIDQSS